MNHKNSLKNNRFTFLILVTLIAALFLTACTGQTTTSTGTSDSSSSGTSNSSTSSGIVQTSLKSDITVEYDSSDTDTSWSTAAAKIALNGSSASVTGTGATVDGSKITITGGGTYVVSGTLSDGHIIVNNESKEVVKIVLNGANITCSNSSPIYAKNAIKVVVVLADGTENTLTDGSNYVLEDTEAGEPNASLFSKTDLTINGNGKLTINANYSDGIASKDDLKIISGDITVNAAGDGIRGRNFVAVKSGTIIINAKGEGIKSNNDEDPSKGFVFIESGTLNIKSDQDAIEAQTSVLIKDGTITIFSGGGNTNGVTKSNMGFGKQQDTTQNNTSSDTVSTKGIKASVNITFDGGTINIDSADDSIHANNGIVINGGNITTTSGDDGIHADAAIEINGGNINIAKSYEGIESAIVTINDGTMNVVASDDGFNVAGGADGSSINGRAGQNDFAASSNNYLYINGGYLTVNAGGDGLDSNGSAKMTGGTVLVNGPTNDGNGALDYNGTFDITGGFLVAAGSGGMAEAPSTSSTQYSALIGFSSTQAANTMVHIATDSGENILTFAPSKEFQTVVISSPELKKGSTYTVYTGGSSTGTAKDGLYTDGAYSGGSKFDSFTVSDITTTVGTINTRGFGGMGGGPGGQGGRKGGFRN